MLFFHLLLLLVLVVKVIIYSDQEAFKVPP